MQAGLLLLIFCMALFAFQYSTKTAIDLEIEGKTDSVFYGSSVMGALFSVSIGARSLFELSMMAKREVEYWEKNRER